MDAEYITAKRSNWLIVSFVYFLAGFGSTQTHLHTQKVIGLEFKTLPQLLQLLGSAGRSMNIHLFCLNLECQIKLSSVSLKKLKRYMVKEANIPAPSGPIRNPALAYPLLLCLVTS